MNKTRTSWNIDSVKKVFKNKGWKLLEDVYINNKTLMKCSCPKKHVQMKSFNYFQKSNECSQCNGNENITWNIVSAKLLFETKKWKLLENVYINNKTPMKCICPKGHEQTKSIDNFQKCRGCAECSNKKKKTIKFIKEYALKDETICNSTVYINSRSLLDFECKNNHEYKMTWSNFQAGHRCSICQYINQSGENNPNWKPDRTRRRRSVYLQFDKRKRFILKEDPLYEKYLKNKEEYHIDHIFPKMAFIDNDLDIKYDKALVKKICNLRENLQILTYKENISKHSKYNQNDFMNWFNSKLKEYNIDEIKV